MDKPLQKNLLGEILARRGLAAQFEAPNPAGCRLGQVSPKRDPARVFAGRKPVFDVLPQRPRHRVTSGGVCDFGLILRPTPRASGAGLPPAAGIQFAREEVGRKLAVARDGAATRMRRPPEDGSLGSLVHPATACCRCKQHRTFATCIIMHITARWQLPVSPHGPWPDCETGLPPRLMPRNPGHRRQCGTGGDSEFRPTTKVIMKYIAYRQIAL
ncbi:MAG: hypothetical protein K2Z80_20260 [Xanthobacteraceae bacterium]|nr:hypothetical protein [Xanthobacteraceae bacterium]